MNFGQFLFLKMSIVNCTNTKSFSCAGMYFYISSAKQGGNTKKTTLDNTRYFIASTKRQRICALAPPHIRAFFFYYICAIILNSTPAVLDQRATLQPSFASSSEYSSKEHFPSNSSLG